MTTDSPLLLSYFRLERLVIEINDQWLVALENDQDVDWKGEYDTTADLEVWDYPGQPDRYALNGLRLRVTSLPKRGERSGFKGYETTPEGQRVPWGDDDPCPYQRVEVTLWGVFKLPEDVAEDMKAQLIRYNAAAILHGIARGIVASASGSCPAGPFLLGVANYADADIPKAEEPTDQ